MDVEHGLNFCVRRLRRALDDDARAARCIETVRHRGSRFVASVVTTPGGVKEKRLIARYPNGAVRFQGEVVTLEGLVLDRTTLTPLPEGAVRQLIETSRDGGATWIVGFDAAYRRRDKG